MLKLRKIFFSSFCLMYILALQCGQMCSDELWVERIRSSAKQSKCGSLSSARHVQSVMVVFIHTSKLPNNLGSFTCRKQVSSLGAGCFLSALGWYNLRKDAQSIYANVCKNLKKTSKTQGANFLSREDVEEEEEEDFFLRLLDFEDFLLLFQS